MVLFNYGFIYGFIYGFLNLFMNRMLFNRTIHYKIIYLSRQGQNKSKLQKQRSNVLISIVTAA